MDISLSTQLDDQEKAELKQYLRAALRNDQYAARFPLRQLAVYIDKVPYLTNTGNNTWLISAPHLYLGRNYLGEFPKGKALAILITLSQFLADDAEVSTYVSRALSKYLIDEFNQLRKGLIVADVPAEGLAFSDDNRQAALFGDTWYLGSGEAVDVTGENWTRCTL